MDAFALIRARARELREAAGVADTQTAAEVVRAVAAERGLEIRPLPPDDDELEGSHGLLCREFAQILLRNDLPANELSEIIAHEIGHFAVHEGAERGVYPRTEDGGSDPSQRIETYGIKERREGQANSFARELVLPRSLARRLFEKGCSAHDIANSLEVRYETVLQQLADGVLLPELAAAEDGAAAVDTPCNPSQQRAVDHRGSPFLTGAGPGTGKTKTLTARVLSLLAEGVPADRILALTFSNRAARELSERVQRAAGDGAINIWAGTFHAFGLDTIRKHHALFGVSSDPRVIDPTGSVAMLEEALPALDLTHYLNLFEPAIALRDLLRGISRAKDELWASDQYLAAAEAMRIAATTAEELEAAAKAREVAIVYRHYQDELTQLGALDYGDLIMLPIFKMREDRDFGALMRDRFDHVLVDEYQDVNRASAMLVRELVGDGDNLWAVGDARQSIYRFRGASAANVARFEQDYPRGRRDGLEENYRSSEEIVDLYTAFGSRMRVSSYAGPAGLDAVKGAGGAPPALFACADPDEEMDVLAGSIRELETANVPLRSQTVLCRSNGALAQVADELSDRDVPVLYLGPLFDRPEVRDLLALLSLVVDDAGTGLVRVAGFPEYSVPLEDTLTVIAGARADGVRVVERLADAENLPGLSPEGRAGLLLLSRHLDGTGPGTTPWFALSRYLFDASDYVGTVLGGSAAADVLRRVAVRQLIDTMRAMLLSGSGTPIRRALDRVRHMILLADERELRHLPPELEGLDGVRLMTIHAAKGLEFEAVHLPGLYKGAIPAANRRPACPPPAGMLGPEDAEAHEAEEECIFFVAMSRAKRHLRLYRPRTRGGRNSNPSPFLDGLRVAAGHEVAKRTRTRQPRAYPPVTAPPAPAKLSARDIERYAGCPRRFFYESVLQLSRRGRGGAYLDAHGCLQRVIAYMRGLDPGMAYDRAQASAVFDQAWAATELDQHLYGPAYRRLAQSMLDRLHASAAGTAAQGGELSTVIGGERISVAADRIFNVGGPEVVRTIRSGRQGSTDADKLSATMLIKAVEETFGPAARIENHYLLGSDPLPITQTRAKYDKRVADCERAVAAIRRGEYSPIENDFQCPRCAFLFICAAP